MPALGNEVKKRILSTNPKLIFNPDRVQSKDATFQNRPIEAGSDFYGEYATLVEAFEDEMLSGTGGFVISGISKSGKTSILDAAAENINIEPIKIQGSQLTSIQSFWDCVADALGAGMQKTVSESFGRDEEGNLSGKFGVGGVAAEGGHRNADKHEHTSVVEFKDRGNAGIMSLLGSSDRPVIIDDFHHCNSATAQQLSEVLKEVVRHSFVALIAIPSVAFAPVLQTVDNTGRFTIIPMPVWSPQELARIGIKGFEELGYPTEMAKEVSFDLASKACGSPFLMQMVCLVFARRIKKSIESEPVTERGWLSVQLEEVRSAVARRTEPKVFVQLLRGLGEKGSAREKFVLADPPVGFEDDLVVDIYGLVMLALRSLGGGEIRDVMVSKLSEAIVTFNPQGENKRGPRIAPNRITNTLKGMSDIAKEFQGNSDPALSYVAAASGDSRGSVTVNDPMLIFYLTYGLWSEKADVRNR